MLNCLKTDFMKLKRSKTFLLIILGMIGPALLCFIVLLYFNSTTNISMTMDSFLSDLTMFQLLTFDVVVFSLLAGFLVVEEYKAHTLKSIITSPISRNKFILSKVLIFEILVILLVILAFIIAVIFGFIGGCSDISLNVIGEAFKKVILGSILLSLPMSLFFALSFIFKNVVPGVIGGVIVGLSNSMIYGSKYAALSPFCSPIMFVENNLRACGYGIDLPLAIVFATFALGVIIALVYFNKKDIAL